MKIKNYAAILPVFLAIGLSGCSSASSGEDSDEFKMNQYYDCVERYTAKNLYTSDEVENVCRSLRP